MPKKKKSTRKKTKKKVYSLEEIMRGKGRTKKTSKKKARPARKKLRKVSRKYKMPGTKMTEPAKPPVKKETRMRPPNVKSKTKPGTSRMDALKRAKVAAGKKALVPTGKRRTVKEAVGRPGKKMKAASSRGKELVKYEQKIKKNPKWFQRVMNSRSGKAALVAAVGYAGYKYLKSAYDELNEKLTGPVRREVERREAVKKKSDAIAGPVHDHPRTKEREEAEAAAKATAKTASEKKAAPAKKTEKAATPGKTLAKGTKVAPQKAKIAPQTARKVRALRQTHGIRPGGNITGEEAFIAAAATAIGGQVPGLYKTAENIAGFLGKNLRPLGLAGLAGGATYAIATYLSRRRQGRSLWEGKKVVDRAKKTTVKPKKKAKRPALTGLYSRGASKKRQRATKGK